MSELLLVNCGLRGLDPGVPRTGALAVAGGRIAAVGTDAEILELRSGSTEVIDLCGATVTPGLVDSHIHPFPSILCPDGLDLRDVRSLDRLRTVLAAAKGDTEDGGWITGFALGYGVFAETGIDGSLLEEAVGTVPLVLHFFDLHTAIATPTALAIAGVDGPRQFAENAEIVCVDGKPTGELREAAAIEAVAAAAPPESSTRSYERARANLQRLAAAGITGLHAMDGDLGRLDLLRELEGNGHLTARTISPFRLTPESEREEWAEFAAAREERGHLWRCGVAKFFIDGVIDSGTGWLFEPDSDGEGLDPFWPDPARYREAVAFMAGHGFQCVTHATGDRAVHEALEAYRCAPPRGGTRHRIEHIETIQQSDLGRFAAEGVVASMQIQHMMDLEADRSDNWSRRLGPERCRRAFPIRTLQESGAQLTLGSDWPVARFDPREGMAAARLRRPPGEPDRVPYDDQAISAEDALRGYTAWPARVTGESDQAGSLSVGNRADLTVFELDPVDCPADELLEDRVLLTVVDGAVVHRAVD